MMSSLDGRLDAVDDQAKKDIIGTLWPAPTEAKIDVRKPDWQPYFVYYSDQCDHALHRQGKHIVVRTHQHIIDIARKLEEGLCRDCIKEDLKKLFTTKKDRPNEDEILNNSIDLAARLYLMVNIRQDKATVTRGDKLQWETGVMKNFLASKLSEQTTLRGSNVRLEHTFKASNLERIADIKIRWTSNLADHLRFVEGDEKIVAIFYHASFLKRQEACSLFPPGLIKETLRTLALLCPPNDRQTKKWFQALPSEPRIDTHLIQCKKLALDERQIEKFHFWHDRLIMLKQAFDESRPKKLSQWWYDRRDGYLWYTFWVAVFVLFLTVFFGIVQSIEGALQVYKAYHPTTG